MEPTNVCSYPFVTCTSCGFHVFKICFNRSDSFPINRNDLFRSFGKLPRFSSGEPCPSRARRSQSIYKHFSKCGRVSCSGDLLNPFRQHIRLPIYPGKQSVCAFIIDKQLCFRIKHQFFPCSVRNNTQVTKRC